MFRYSATDSFRSCGLSSCFANASTISCAVLKSCFPPYFSGRFTTYGSSTMLNSTIVANDSTPFVSTFPGSQKAVRILRWTAFASSIRSILLFSSEELIF